MIKLEIEEYCEDCPYFEAKITKDILRSNPKTTIRCINKDKCASIASRLKQALE